MTVCAALSTLHPMHCDPNAAALSPCRSSAGPSSDSEGVRAAGYWCSAAEVLWAVAFAYQFLSESKKRQHNFSQNIGEI